MESTKIEKYLSSFFLILIKKSRLQLIYNARRQSSSRYDLQCSETLGRL